MLITCHVFVLVAEFLGLAKANAVDDGGVIQLVGDDGVVGRQHGLEQAGVGVETARVENGILATVKLGDPPLQFLRKMYYQTETV